jgi:general secretion pathway protein D
MTRKIAVLLFFGLAQFGSPALAQESGKPEPTPAQAETGPTIDLQVLLEQVAENSGKKFLVEMRVPHTIHIGGVGADDPSYPVLLSILRNNGLVAAEIGGYVNILPDAAIRQQPLELVQRDDPDIPAEEWVSRVITVPGGRAPWLVPILRPLIPQNGHLSATPSPDGKGMGDKLIIIASYAKVQQITEIVELLNE